LARTRLEGKKTISQTGRDSTPGPNINNMKIFKFTLIDDKGTPDGRPSFYPSLTKLFETQEAVLPVSKPTLDRAEFPYESGNVLIEKFDGISFEYKSKDDLNVFLDSLAEILEKVGHPCVMGQPVDF
jgi:hypothetical protein